ncbi:CHASE2 domain-containing protein [Verrucomicrobiota bacterium]
MSKKIIHGIIIGAAAAIVSLCLYSAGWLEWIEGPAWDLRVRTLAKPDEASDRIRLIFLDQTSLDSTKEESSELNLPWPWPREVYTAIINFCQRGGAKAIVFDVTFTEPSYMGVHDDELLGSAIAQTKGFVTTVFLSNDQGTSTNWPIEEIPEQQLNVEGMEEYTRRHELKMPRAAFPIPEIATNSALIGNVYAVADPDAIIRRIAPFSIFDGHFVPSLGLAAFLAGDPNAEIGIKNNILRVGKHSIPLDSDGNAILRFRGPSQTHKTVSAYAVIQSELRLIEGKNKPVLQPDFFKDKYVFLGFTAPGLLDLKATPMSTIYPGVEVHATLLDNLFSDNFIRDVPFAATLCLVIALSLATGIIGRLCLTGWQTALAFLIMIPLPFLPAFMAYAKGFWLPLGIQETGVILALTGSVILNYAIEGRQKRFIKKAFGQYVSSTVLEQIQKNPDTLKLGGELKELSIFFSDIQGFTGISENLPPQKLTALLNEYLTAMTDIIMEEGGYLDKYEGDAMIAFWNAPLYLPVHASCAVRSALRCNKKLAELRPVFKEKYGKEIFARIGINTGPVVVGNMGSNQRFDYTFLGDAGNLASRLEGVNKQFGTYLMISEFTYKQLGTNFAAREISRVKVVGREEPIRIYEPMFKEDYTQRSDIINKFTKALKMYYDGQFKEALEFFSKISDQDPPAKAYVESIKEKKLIEDPPQDWDGVWIMKEK